MLERWKVSQRSSDAWTSKGKQAALRSRMLEMMCPEKGKFPFG
jgi:hypothetical protein